jgi:hypothetical protein
MKNAFRLSILAGLCLAAPAIAAEDTLVPAGSLQRVPASCLSMPTVEFGNRANAFVYEVRDLDNAVFTNTALPLQLLEDASLIPGPGSGATFPLVANGMYVSFSVTAPVDFDVEVTFWDAVDVAAPAGSPVHTTLIDGFVVGIANLPNGGAFVTDTIDLTGLAGGGITLPDAGTFVRVRYLQPGTTDLMPSGSVQIVYDASNDIVTFASNITGASDINTWRDADADTILEAAEARSFAYPGRGAMVMGIQADVPVSGGGGCAADFNGDSFLDFFDYDEFVQAFENGTGC